MIIEFGCTGSITKEPTGQIVFYLFRNSPNFLIASLAYFIFSPQASSKLTLSGTILVPTEFDGFIDSPIGSLKIFTARVTRHNHMIHYVIIPFFWTDFL